VKAKNKRVLTELAVRKTKATDGRAVILWDAACPGLTLKVQPSGHRAFRFYYSINGRARWHHIGLVYLSDARRIGFKLRAAIAEGRDPAAERQAQRGAITFGDLAARHLAVAKTQNKSWRQADSYVRRHLLPKWAKLDAKTITRADVRAMMERIKAAPIAANGTLAAASAIFKWAVKQEIIVNNPAQGVERNPTTDRERILSDSEIAAFWEEFDSLDPIRGAALKTLLLSGQRKSEVAHMRWEHIKDDWWEKPGQPVPAMGWPGTKNGKNGKNHRVWLVQEVRAIITRAVIPAGGERAGFVFSRPSVVRGVDRDMKEICEKLGCERAVVHDLRRTFGSTVTRLRFGRQAMDRILNHSDPSVGTVYDRHSYADEDRRIMERVAQHIVAIAEGRKDDNVVFAKFHGAEPA
jgi:integrase